MIKEFCEYFTKYDSVIVGTCGAMFFVVHVIVQGHKPIYIQEKGWESKFLQNASFRLRKIFF